MKSFIISLLIGASVFLCGSARAGDFQSQQLSRYGLEAPRLTAGGHLRIRLGHPTGQQGSYAATLHRSSKAHRRFKDGRPKAWCGWYMRQVKGVSNPSFNVALKWSTFGSPSNPRIGAVVVWPHHVGYIVGGSPGNWIVRSGNWNNRVADVPLRRMGRPIAYRI